MSSLKLSDSEIETLTARFQRAMRLCKHKQKDVIYYTGLRQYQVSRIVNGQFKSLNMSVKKLCNYADYCLGPIEEDTQNVEKQLVQSVLELWDGSVADGLGIIGFLRGLKLYRESGVRESSFS